VVGYRAGDITAELAAIGARSFVTTIHNPAFHEGSLVSLWAARAALASGDDILFMDADVLYDPVLIERLVDTKLANAFLIDRDFEPGDEPVKLCLRDGVLAEFRKKIDGPFDVVGEWPGFLRLAPAEAKKLAAALDAYVTAGRRDQPYEEPMRDVLLADPKAFGLEDITGTPWIEIDFPEDLARAEKEILPLLRLPVRKRVNA
jgi:choline kinase